MHRTRSSSDALLPSSPSTVLLRPATVADVDAVTEIWHAGWQDAHLGHVPDALLRHRTRADLTRLARDRVTQTTVAVLDGRLVGFVVVEDDELEQIYVAADVRRQGVATALLARAEAIVGSRFDTAWLAVVAGNTTARRFYRRQGWRDDGPFDNPAPTADGPLLVPAHRYTKRVRAALEATP